MKECGGDGKKMGGGVKSCLMSQILTYIEV